MSSGTSSCSKVSVAGRSPWGFLLPGLGQRGRGVGRDSLVGFAVAPLEHELLHLVFANFLQPDLVVDLLLTELHVLVLLHLLQHRVDCALDASAELFAPAGSLCVGATSLERAFCDQASNDADDPERTDARLLVECAQPVLHERVDARPRDHGVTQQLHLQEPICTGPSGIHYRPYTATAGCLYPLAKRMYRQGHYSST